MVKPIDIECEVGNLIAAKEDKGWAIYRKYATAITKTKSFIDYRAGKQRLIDAMNRMNETTAKNA